MHGGNVVRTYHVLAGPEPRGRRSAPGTSARRRASTGSTRRNPRSDYFLSIQVSYPNDAGHPPRARPALGHRRLDHDPRAAEHLKHEPDYYEYHDWTDGCIAVSNADMVEIWMMTPDDMPIDILP